MKFSILCVWLYSFVLLRNVLVIYFVCSGLLGNRMMGVI